MPTLRNRKLRHRIAKQLATRSQSQEEADLRFKSLELDFGWSPVSSPQYGASRLRDLLLWEALLDLSVGLGPGMGRTLPLPIYESQLLNCQEFCKPAVKHSNY